MKIKYKKEEELLSHYEFHKTYWTFTENHNLLDEVLEFHNIDKKNIKSVLDVGCGNGLLGKYFSDANFVGVDYSNERIKNAKNLNLNNCTFIRDDIHYFLDDALKKSRKFELIALFEVLEHLENPNEVLNKCKKLINKGQIIASVPHNMPYKAHLQVFKNEHDVIKRLKPSNINKKNRQFFCSWVILSKQS